MSAPKGSKPNLIFKAPTYIFRVSKILSPRQGGSYYPVVHGLFLIFLALTVMVLRVRTKIDMTFKLCKPLNNTLSYCTFLQIHMLMEDLKGVYSIETVEKVIPGLDYTDFRNDYTEMLRALIGVILFLSVKSEIVGFFNKLYRLKNFSQI